MGKKYIKKVIDHIESNLFDAINIQSLSQSFYVSAMQLYRDFYSYTGHSVKEYVRRRRLSCALAMVKHSDIPLVDIAISTGYSSQQNFTKYVKSVVGMSPLQYKKSEFEYYFPPMDVEASHQITVMTKKIPKCIAMEYYSSSLKDIERDAVAYFMSIIPEFDGRVFGRNGKSVDGMFCYELYITYSDEYMEELQSSKMQNVRVKNEYESMFAMTTVANSEDEINRAWDYLYVDWLKTSMFHQSDVPYFEEYIVKNGVIKKLVLHLPIKKKAGFNSISIMRCDKRRFLVATKIGIHAEKQAASLVLEYVKMQYPKMLHTGNRYYYKKKDDSFTCGIGIDDSFALQSDSYLEILEIPSAEYAIIDGDCTGDTDIYNDILDKFLKENNIKSYGDAFAIYSTYDGFDDKDIKMSLYRKIK